jgi:hypothetical protein
LKFDDFKQKARKILDKGKFNKFVFYSEALIGQIDYDSRELRKSRVKALTNSILVLICKFTGMQKKEFVFILNGGSLQVTRIRLEKVSQNHCYSMIKKVWKRIYKFLPTISGLLAGQTSTPRLIV